MHCPHRLFDSEVLLAHLWKTARRSLPRKRASRLIGDAFDKGTRNAACFWIPSKARKDAGEIRAASAGPTCPFLQWIRARRKLWLTSVWIFQPGHDQQVHTNQVPPACSDYDESVGSYMTLGLRQIVDSPPPDQEWLRREARLRDPAGNRLRIYRAGQYRRFPRWRIAE